MEVSVFLCTYPRYGIRRTNLYDGYRCLTIGLHTKDLYTLLTRAAVGATSHLPYQPFMLDLTYEYP